MHRTEPTSLQNMALQLAEKLGSLVENNERVFDLKQGVYGGYFNRGAFSCIATSSVFACCIAAPLRYEFYNCRNNQKKSPFTETIKKYLFPLQIKKAVINRSNPTREVC